MNGTSWQSSRPSHPALSVIIVIFDMEREARRSLHSLSSQYQQGVLEDDYEVIVVDNGSRRPFCDGSLAEFGPNFRYYYVRDANRSPARALNIGIAMARSDYLALMIDGARILSPGVLRYGLLLPKIYARPFGYTHGFHLGPDFQSRSMMQGYTRQEEDTLLEQIGWPQDGYRLFEISSQHDPTDGWFRIVGESNFSFVHRDVLEQAGGISERFVSAGGGMLNPGLQSALSKLPDVQLVILLGEGTFHQFHGGATSGTPWTKIPDMLEEFWREYEEIQGDADLLTHGSPSYIGHLPEPARRFLPKFSEAAAIAEREETIRSLHGAVMERDKTVTWLHAEVAQRDRQVLVLRNEIRQLRAEAARHGVNLDAVKSSARPPAAQPVSEETRP